MGNSLHNFSDTLADAVETAAASIVRVEARRRMPATGIVWSQDGLILTAHHVVRRDDNIQIGFADGSSAQAQIVGRDPTTDLALLKADVHNCMPLQHVAENGIRVGHFVLALGRPGSTVQATSGIVSAYDKGWRTPFGGQIDQYLQTDVLMYPGFSGGALINASGQLLGLNSSALLPGTSTAVPITTLQRISQTLLAHGRMQRGYLGVRTQRVRLPKELSDSLNQKTGLLIVSTESGSPAEEGGLILGDTLIALGDNQIATHEDLLAALSGDQIGQKVPFNIIRGGEVRTVNVKIGERS